MARYRKVDVRMWGDDWFRSLTPIPACGAGLWIFLLTGENSTVIPGIVRGGEAALAEILNWEIADFRNAFKEIAGADRARADWRNRVVWIPNAIRYNEPQSPNVIRSWETTWGEIPDCPLKLEIYRELKAHVYTMGRAFAEAFEIATGKASPKTSGKASPNKEQEQEQEQEHDSGEFALTAEPTEKTKAKRDKKPVVPHPGFEEFWTAYPRKVARPFAQDCWNKQKPPLAEVLKALDWQKRTWTEPRYIPHPSTYLNRRQWHSEPDGDETTEPANDPNAGMYEPAKEDR